MAFPRRRGCGPFDVQIVVTTNDDELDDPSANNVMDVGGPGDVSLREAMVIANNTPGLITEIRFDPVVFTNSATNDIAVGSGAAGSGQLPVVGAGETCIDGSGTFVVLDGSAVGGGGLGFDITSPNNVFASLTLVGFTGDVFSIGVAGADNNRIADCSIGVAGGMPIGNGDEGVDIAFGANNIVGPGNVIVASAEWGVQIGGADGTVVVGNLIGLVGSMISAPNGQGGINLSGSANVTIGGATPADANVIAFNSGPGINIGGAASSALIIANNFIGITPTGVAAGNSGDGIVVNGATGVVIGPSNFISWAGGNGVSIFGGAVGITVTQSLINMVAFMPIELDVGSNMDVMPPAVTAASMMAIQGTAPGPGTVEVFGGNGDLECYYGSAMVAMGGTWALPWTSAMSCGPSIVATYTDTAGNTSIVSSTFPSP